MGAAALLLSGCTMIPAYHTPKAPVASAWNGSRGVQADPAELDDWHVFYRDPVMRQLIAMALENNRDLRIARQQMSASASQFDVENAALFPTLNGAAFANVQKQYAGTYSLSQGGGSFFLREYAVGFGVSAYEVDLWGHIRSASRAAFDRYMSDALNRESMQLSVIADVSAAMLDWVADNEAVGVTENVLENRQRNFDLVKQTRAMGTGTALDVTQAETLLHDAETNLQIYRRQRAEALNQLELLVGMPLGSAIRAQLASRHTLSDVAAFPAVPAGLPSDMIARRPDILAAEDTLRAANDDIGVARAEFFPKIQITAGNGTASNNITRLFQSGMGAWNIAPQITLPIFDAGRLSAQLRQAKARKKQEIAQYEKTVQTAFKEVANALVGRETYVAQRQAQDALVASSRRQYALAMQRFKGGYDPYLDALVAQQSLFQAQLAAITTHLQQMTNMVTLYKALGGGWSTHPEKAVPASPVEHIL